MACAQQWHGKVSTAPSAGQKHRSGVDADAGMIWVSLTSYYASLPGPLAPLGRGGCSRGVDLDDSALHKGLGADKLVVGRVVDDVQDARLARADL